MIISNVRPDVNQPYKILPLDHSWDQSFKETIEFKTDIIQSSNLREQRRAVRYHPRRMFDYYFPFWGKRKQAFEWFMLKDPAMLTWVPEESCVVRTTEAMIEDAQGVGYRGVKKDWMVVGMTVILSDDWRKETRVLASVNDGHFEFTEFNKTTWPVGTKITPGRLARVAVNPQATHLTDRVATMSVQAVLDPKSNVIVFDNNGAEGLGSREWFKFRPNWASSPSLIHGYQRDDLDFGFGAIRSFSPSDFPQWTRQLVFNGKTHADVDQLRKFFGRHRGQQRSFFMQTYEPDIPYTALAATSVSIIIDGLDFALSFGNSTVFRRLVIRMKTGELIHAQVDAVVPLPDTNVSVIQLAEPLPDINLAPSETFGISWVLASVFSSDSLVIEWLTAEVAQTTMSMRSVENFDL